MSIIEKPKRKRGPSARGLARRQELEKAAEVLLESTEIDEISLADIAKHANIPVASAYAFYDNVNDLFANLQITHTNNMFDKVENGIDPQLAQNWMEIVDKAIEGTAQCLRDSRILQQLRLSNKTRPEIRYAIGRTRGVDFAARLQALIEEAFVLPKLEEGNRPFIIMLDLAEAIIVSEFIRSHDLPAGIATEAKRAAVAYLKLYIPEHLPRRETT